MQCIAYTSCMSKKPTLSVATEYGTFTRETARPYAFVIASKGKTADAYRAERAAAIAYAAKKLAEYRQVVATGVVPAGYRLTVAHYVEIVANQERLLAELQAKPDDADEKAAETTQWGWSADRRNAEKVANKARGFG